MCTLSRLQPALELPGQEGSAFSAPTRCPAEPARPRSEDPRPRASGQYCRAAKPRAGIYYRDPTGSAAPADHSFSLAAWRETTPPSPQRSSVTGSRVRDDHASSPRIHKSHAPFSWKLGMLRSTVALISPPTSRAIGAAGRLRPRPHSSPLAGKAGTRSGLAGRPADRGSTPLPPPASPRVPQLPQFESVSFREAGC